MNKVKNKVSMSEQQNKEKIINILIVHYNTPKLTECLIRSINKQVQHNSNIYIFDNSDEMPLLYRQNNIVYIDNTEKQIIDFDEWLKRFEGRHRVCYSAKHCYTVQKFIDLYNIPFILLDSDVLLKKDISELFDTSMGFIGDISNRKRVFPFICFINPEKLTEHGIQYFIEDKMYGLPPNSNNYDWDTGAVLYDNRNVLPYKAINYKDYIEHYTAGSYKEDVFNILHKGQISKEKWIEKNKQYWFD